MGPYLCIPSLSLWHGGVRIVTSSEMIIILMQEHLVSKIKCLSQQRQQNKNETSVLGVARCMEWVWLILLYCVLCGLIISGGI